MGNPKFIIVDHASQKPSQNSTKQALDGCMEIAGGLFTGLQATTEAILAKKGRNQPGMYESIRTGRKPDIFGGKNS